VASFLYRKVFIGWLVLSMSVLAWKCAGAEKTGKALVLRDVTKVVGVTGFEPAYSRSQAERVRPDFPTPRDSRAWFGRVQVGRGIDGAIPAHVFFFLRGIQASRFEAYPLEYSRVSDSKTDQKECADDFQGPHETIKPLYIAVGQPGRLPHKRVIVVSTVYVCSVLQYGFCGPQSIGVDCGEARATHKSPVFNKCHFAELALCNLLDLVRGVDFDRSVIRIGRHLGNFQPARVIVGAQRNDVFLSVTFGNQGFKPLVKLCNGHGSIDASGPDFKALALDRGGIQIGEGLLARRRSATPDGLGVEVLTDHALRIAGIHDGNQRLNALRAGGGRFQKSWHARDFIMGAGSGSVYRAPTPDPLRRSTAPISSGLWQDQTWWRRKDLNPRPLGYEPSELPDCSTPLKEVYHNSGFPQLGIICGKAGLGFGFASRRGLGMWKCAGAERSAVAAGDVYAFSILKPLSRATRFTKVDRILRQQHTSSAHFLASIARYACTAVFQNRFKIEGTRSTFQIRGQCQA
jgi:hypothetical protein